MTVRKYADINIQWMAHGPLNECNLFTDV